MASSRLSTLASRSALLLNSYFAQCRGGACSINSIRSFRLSYKICFISSLPLSSDQRLSFSSITPRGCSSSKLTRENLVVLGIETSCDDTAAAIVRGNGEILGEIVSSQEDLLSRYGGVYPKMAEEAHSLVIDQVVQQAMNISKLTGQDLSAVAVTIGPGLSLCLRDVLQRSTIRISTISINAKHSRGSMTIGVTKAQRVAGRFNLPIIGVHHMEAHALVTRLVDRELQFPFLALLISGGHNLLVLARGVGHYVQLGTTIDDAIGEAFDKTARWLGLDMSKGGGPAVEELARDGDSTSLKFKVPLRQYKDCNFSYAGLKTQVRLAVESRNVCVDNNPISSASFRDRKSRADIAASFQRVAVLHLEERCQRAIAWAKRMESSIDYLVVAGGVASNQYVRSRLIDVAEKNSIRLVCPPPKLCTDNGVMVAWTGIEHLLLGGFGLPLPAHELEDCICDVRPRWPLGEEYIEGRSEARSLKRARIHPSLTSIIRSSTRQQI